MSRMSELDADIRGSVHEWARTVLASRGTLRTITAGVAAKVGEVGGIGETVKGELANIVKTLADADEFESASDRSATAEAFVKVPLEAAREAVEAFDQDRERGSLVLCKVVLMVEEDMGAEVEPCETLQKIRELVNLEDVPGWYAELMAGISEHSDAATAKAGAASGNGE